MFVGREKESKVTANNLKLDSLKCLLVYGRRRIKKRIDQRGNPFIRQTLFIVFGKESSGKHQFEGFYPGYQAVYQSTRIQSQEFL